MAPELFNSKPSKQLFNSKLRSKSCLIQNIRNGSYNGVEFV